LKICARNQANNPNMDENGATRLAIWKTSVNVYD